MAAAVRTVVYCGDAAAGAAGATLPAVEHATVAMDGPAASCGECSICIDAFEAGAIVSQLKCGHVFHPEVRFLEVSFPAPCVCATCSPQRPSRVLPDIVFLLSHA